MTVTVLGIRHHDPGSARAANIDVAVDVTAAFVDVAGGADPADLNTESADPADLNTESADPADLNTESADPADLNTEMELVLA